MHITIKVNFFEAMLESIQQCKSHNWWPQIPDIDYPFSKKVLGNIRKTTKKWIICRWYVTSSKTIL